MSIAAEYDEVLTSNTSTPSDVLAAIQIYSPILLTTMLSKTPTWPSTANILVSGAGFSCSVSSA